MRWGSFAHGAIMLAATMFANIAMFVYHVALSHALGVERYGVLYTLVSTATFVAVLASILAVIVARFVAEAKASASTTTLAALAGGSLKSGLIAGLLSAALVMSVSSPLSSFLHVHTMATIWMLALFSGTQFVLAAARGVMQGMQRFSAFAASLVVESLIRTGLALGFVAAGAGVSAAIGAYAAGSALGAFFTIAALYRILLPTFSRTGIPTSAVWKISVGAAVSTAAVAALGVLDVVLVRHYFGNENSGVYSAVSLAGKIVYLAAGFLPMVMLPKATAAAAEGRNPRRILIPAALTMAGLSSGTLLLFWFVPGQIVHALAGPQYSAAAQYIFRYAIAMTLLGCTNALVAYRIALSDFTFVPLLVGAVAAQALGIALFHASIDHVLVVVIATNGAAFAAAVFGLPARLRLKSSALALDPSLVAENFERI